MKQILPFLKPYKNRLILDGALFFIITVCSLLMPYLMSDIVNVGIKNGDMPYILRQGALMLALSAAMLVSGLATTKINSKIASGFSADLQRGVFQKINSLTFEEYESIGTSSLITRSTDDIFTLQEVSKTFARLIQKHPGNPLKSGYFPGYSMFMRLSGMAISCYGNTDGCTSNVTRCFVGAWASVWECHNHGIPFQVN